MRCGRVVPAEAFFGLLEIAADDVLEFLELWIDAGLEGIEVVDADLPRRAVPFMLPRVIVVALDVGFRIEILAEQPDIHIGILVAEILVREEAERLVIANAPAHFLVDIGLDELRAPVAMIRADEADDADIVQEAGENDLLAVAALSRKVRALQ